MVDVAIITVFVLEAKRSVEARLIIHVSLHYVVVLRHSGLISYTSCSNKIRLVW